MCTSVRRASCDRTSTRRSSGSRFGATTLSDVPREFAQRIRRIPVYPVASGYDLGEDVALLASNESCFPPLPEVAEAAQRALNGTHRYPDPAYVRLRRALADRYGIAPDRI